MARVVWRRIEGFVIGSRAPWGDEGTVTVVMGPHPYLYCLGCAAPLSQGQTTAGAPVFVCYYCKRIADTRRIA